MRFAAVVICAALIFTCALPASVCAQDRQAAPPKGEEPSQQQPDEQQPTPAPLAMGSLAIASNNALSIESAAVDVTIDRVTYTYKLANKSQAALALAASVAQPDLEVSDDNATTYALPSDKADNVVELEVKSNGQLIFTTPQVQAIALGVDRRAVLASAQIPLVPFGEATDKALAGAPPDAIAKLEGLGLVVPRDPAQKDAPIVGDWSLHVAHSWTQNIGPNASAEVTVAFSPIKAIYTIDASSLASFDALKDAACLTPQLLSSVKALLVAKGSTVDVADILLANDGAARWGDNPPAHVAIHKPTPDSLVMFCGLDPKTQKAAIVTGTMPNNDELESFRVLIFARNPQ